MFKMIIAGMVVFTTLVASDDYAQEMDSLITDAKKIETVLVDKGIDYLSKDEYIDTKMAQYEVDTKNYIKTLTNKLNDEGMSESMLLKTQELSKGLLSLANAVVNLSDKTGTNANESYLSTLDTLTSTTLRLSDDIGLMADRIGEMSDDIGTMADRIVETEKLINEDINMINNSMVNVIDKFEFNKNQTNENQNMQVEVQQNLMQQNMMQQPVMQQPTMQQMPAQQQPMRSHSF